MKGRFLKLVYDRKYNCLLYEPGRIKVLKIEAWANDRSFILGITKIFFPNKKWVRAFYVGEKGNLIDGYLKHIRNLF